MAWASTDSSVARVEPLSPDGARGDFVTACLTVYIVVLFAVPSRLVVGPLGSAGSISMLLGLVSFGLWVVLLLVGFGRVMPPTARPLRWALGAFAFSVGVSYVLAMSQPISSDEISPADVAILSLTSWAGIMLLSHDGITSSRKLGTVLWRFVFCGGLLALLGIAQFATRQAIVDLISIPGLTSIADATLYNRNGLVRPAGTAIHPIEYGTLLCILLPLALHVGLHYRERPPVLRWFPAVAIAGVIAISSSRSAYLGAVLGVVICMVAWTSKQRRILITIVAVGFAVASIALPRLITSITNLFVGVEEDPSIASRTDSFSFAWAFIAEHPLFGRGLGTFLPKYRIFDNQYLGMLVTIGVVGALALVAIGIVAMSQLMRVYQVVEDPRTSDLSVSLVASVAAGFVSLAFFDAFAFPMTMGTLFLVLGLVGAFSRLSLRDAAGERPSFITTPF
ncbi:O-antigen ligase family protein [Microbacterium sp.]|uniref:O-antigen ligase family protein n=1 Tax=Microbacterium sp. TaxID=51671 RepID=UPI002D7E4BC7|nr:O-antigen ligase family protein [Microbacterium sp.]